MKRELFIHWRWLTALSIASACGDDGAVATSGETETESESSSDDGPSTITVTSTTLTTTDPDDSGSSSESATSTVDESSTTTAGESSESSTTGVPEDCGNGQIDDGEVCDGDALGGQTCMMQGHVAGSLGCLPDCSDYDDTQCVDMVCGDGMVDGTEECDGADLGATPTCEDLDYDGGTLACNEDTCTYDETGCISFSCGDGSINGATELCDGADFGPATCESQNAGVGNLSCTNNCQIDTSTCCGSNTIGGAELCDGTHFGAETCETQGDFDGGVLTCSNDCSMIDTSGCTLCGDGTAEGTESCDTADLANQDCTTVPGGFAGGTLACAADCSFDTTGCNFCGNGAIDAGEECDEADLGVATCVTEGHTGGTLACAGGCLFDESGCTDFPLPAAGELVITEIMQNPNVTTDEAGEWFEIHNPSLAGSFQLLGCEVENDDGTQSFIIGSDLVVNAGDYVTLARSAMPGFTPDYVYPSADFPLANAGDTIRIVCAGATVDEVTYDGTFPQPNGASMQLDTGFENAGDNDVGANWCESLSNLGNDDFGTPGAANDGCSPPTFTIDYCNLQSPTSIDTLEGTMQTVYSRLYIAGLTDQSAMNDPAANVFGWVGYGPDGTDPATDPGWTWVMAAPNPLWVGMGFPDQNNDEYQASFAAPITGTYDYAYRFSGSGLAGPYTYCDTDGTDAVDPYEIANAGSMVTHPAGDPALMYFSEYVEGSGASNKALEIYNPGTEQVFLGQCELRAYFNGNMTFTATVLTNENVDAGDVFVICNTNMGPPQNAACDRFNGTVVQYNGNDALALVCNSQIIDVIGQIEFDPMATGWGVDPTNTVDNTLRRQCDVTAGDPNGMDAFDPTVEWDGFVTDTFDGLGTRGCP